MSLNITWDEYKTIIWRLLRIKLLKYRDVKEKYFCQDLIDDDTKGIIIDLLYKLLIKINKENWW